MKVICIGRNYADHAKEMNAEVPSAPVFFMKPDSSILRDGSPFFYPEFTKDLHYECEIVVKINKLGKNISEKFAHTYYDEIGLGIDFTARDLQGEAKSKGLPWEIGKAFDNSAFISKKWINKADLDLENISFSLTQNGTTVQNGSTSDLIFSFDKVIAYISQFVTLKIGDLIYTGTPAGVGPIQIGDKLEGFIGEKKMYSLNIK
ncbi:MAG: fumarylacetoacetate hydrolase family protein [Fluviicola sp.]|jgi:2-keto-4-pentenoate hydratase/2-oxohepta-3-ene-1,7-dioic acid hydratase in catechol pathway|nr:fumarylacetoacetate hydrolase family protein [Fluviicola sp.]